MCTSDIRNRDGLANDDSNSPKGGEIAAATCHELFLLMLILKIMVETTIRMIIITPGIVAILRFSQHCKDIL